jgi:hypothetical protein
MAMGKRQARGVWAAGLLTLWGLTLAVPAVAQDRMIVIEDSEWVVDLEKPSAYFMLQPSNLNYDEEEAEESFLEALYQTVEDAPF